MTTMHDDNATTWRDLADQLTSEQVDNLAAMERHSTMPPSETAASLLEGAREWATANVVDQVVFGDLEPPADAARWCMEEREPGVWARSFDGTERKVDDAQVFISGWQYEDGRSVRRIGIEARSDYDAPAARRIAAAIIAAADEIEGLQ